MTKVFVGDPSKCHFCRDAVFPHQHGLEETPTGLKAARETMSKSVGRRLMATGKIPTITDQPKRKRGRPPKPETIELFRTCEYNGEHPKS